METLCIPRRFQKSDPAERIGIVTDKHERSDSVRRFLEVNGFGIKDGKVVRMKRRPCALMQVFSVQFPDSNEEELDHICGQIFVERFRIFNRPRDKTSPHDFDSEGYARLNGPLYPIKADLCDLRILPKLYRKNWPNHFFHPDRGITFDFRGTPIGVQIPYLDVPGMNGKYLFELRSISDEYNTLLSTDVRTSCGPLKVNWATFDDAAEAFLTFRLVEWNKEGNGANVYGKIRTYNTLLCDDGAKTVVFDLKRDESQRVKPKQYIRSHRHVTVVPMGYELKVEVELELENMMSSEDNDDRRVSVSHTCSFKARTTKYDVDLLYPPRGYNRRFTFTTNESSDDEVDKNANEDDPSSYESSSDEVDQNANEDDPSSYESSSDEVDKNANEDDPSSYESSSDEVDQNANEDDPSSYESSSDEVDQNANEDDPSSYESSSDEVDQNANEDDPSSYESSSDEVDQNANEDDPSSYESSDDEEDQSSEGSDDLLYRKWIEEREESDYCQIVEEPHIISGEWGKIEVGVCWLPCWCFNLNQDEDLSNLEA